MLRRISDARGSIPAVARLTDSGICIESRSYTARPIVLDFRVETPKASPKIDSGNPEAALIRMVLVFWPRVDLVHALAQLFESLVVISPPLPLPVLACISSSHIAL